MTFEERCEAVSLVIEGGWKKQNVATKYQVHPKTIGEWVARYQQSNSFESLRDKSRRAHHRPNALSPSTVTHIQTLYLTETGLKRPVSLIARLLKETYNETVSNRTIWKYVRKFDPPEKKPDIPLLPETVTREYSSMEKPDLLAVIHSLSEQIVLLKEEMRSYRDKVFLYQRQMGGVAR